MRFNSAVYIERESVLSILGTEHPPFTKCVTQRQFIGKTKPEVVHIDPSVQHFGLWMSDGSLRNFLEPVDENNETPLLFGD